MKNCVIVSQLCGLCYVSVWKSTNSPSMLCACIQNEIWTKIGSGYTTVLHSAYMQAVASLSLSCLCLYAHRWLTWGHKLNPRSWKWLSIWQVSTGCYACFLVHIYRQKEAFHLQPSTPFYSSPSPPPLSSLRCISHHFHSDIVSCPRIVETIKMTF